MREPLHPVDLYAGEKLREIRKLRGLSAAKLGQLLPKPITFQQIQKYEKGINRMSLSRIYDFAEVLQVSIQHFIPESAFEDGAVPVITRQECDMINCMRVLPDQCRNSIGALLKELRKIRGISLSE